MINIKDIQIDRITRKHAIAYCPHHEDNNTPNLYINITDNYYGHWVCWACGMRGIFTEKEMRELNLSKSKKRQKPINIDWASLIETYRSNLSHYSLSYSLNTLLDIDEVYYNYGWDGEAYTFSMCNAKEEIIGIQRRFPDGTKCCVEGSQLGIFIPSYLKPTEPVFITEGASDMLAVCDLGLYAIGKPSATAGEDIIVKYLSNNNLNNIILLPDKDEAGTKSAYSLFAKLVFKGFRVRIYNKFHETFATDIREYISYVGKECAKYDLEEEIKCL